MNSPSSIYYYHGNGNYCSLMVQRHKDNGEEGLECECCDLTEAEAQLMTDWAQKLLDSKAFRFVSMAVRGWTIFLPERKRDITPLDTSPLTRLIQAIGRYEPMANDPDVIDAINAVEDVLMQTLKRAKEGL